ncbi:hypothetical protein GF377_09090 [candidate division GN15 bacterium]|nr:hypothetical protein [candidate division GN15 bacterium]
MKKLSRLTGISMFAVMALLIAGCIVSGTFVVTIFIGENDFTAGTQLYFYAVDLTDEEDWEDHEEHIDNIDVIGFELWINNSGGSATTFEVWVRDIMSDTLTSYAEVTNTSANGTFQVLRDLTIQPGDNHITYGQSLSKVINGDRLRTAVEDGIFQYYGYSSVGQPGAAYTIDSARVIVTVSASE